MRRRTSTARSHQTVQVLGSQLNIEVFTLGDKVDPADIAAGAMERAKSFGYDTVILDTADAFT